MHFLHNFCRARATRARARKNVRDSAEKAKCMTGMREILYLACARSDTRLTVVWASGNTLVFHKAHFLCFQGIENCEPLGTPSCSIRLTCIYTNDTALFSQKCQCVFHARFEKIVFLAGRKRSSDYSSCCRNCSNQSQPTQIRALAFRLN